VLMTPICGAESTAAAPRNRLPAHRRMRAARKRLVMKFERKTRTKLQ
jgi:hypothetical protein